MDEIQLLKEFKDPIARMGKAESLINAHRVAMHRLAIVRAMALQELRTKGMSVADIADQLGVTRQQVYRLIREAVGTG